MDSIKNFLREVSTCDVSNGLNGSYSYNGIGLDGTSSAFQKRLNSLYEEALMEVQFLNQEAKDGLIDVIDRYRETQSLFDAPNESCLNSMNREIENGNTNASLKRERDFVKMVCECISIQKFYLGKFATTIGHTPLEQELPQATQTLSEDKENDAANQEWVYGYEGIMAAFNWKSRYKVDKFLKDVAYEDAIYRDGRKIAVNVPEARELMQKKEKERKNPKRKR